MSRKKQVWDLCDKVERDLKLAGLSVEGSSTDETSYSSIKAMWSAELGFGGLAPSAVGIAVY